MSQHTATNPYAKPAVVVIDEHTIDPDAIAKAVMNSRTGAFRRSAPTDTDATYGAKYVWRMVRFHTGIDMSMPVGILWFDYPRNVHDALEAVTDWLAYELAGPRSFRAAARWGAALGLTS